MRVSIRIDDDLHRALKDRARRERVSLSDLVNRELRHGIAVLRHEHEAEGTPPVPREVAR